MVPGLPVDLGLPTASLGGGVGIEVGTLPLRARARWRFPLVGGERRVATLVGSVAAATGRSEVTLPGGLAASGFWGVSERARLLVCDLQQVELHVGGSDPEHRPRRRRKTGPANPRGQKWFVRWEQASELQRCSLACLADRSSRPTSSPRSLLAGEQERICAERRRTGWGPRLIAGALGHPHQTVWKVLCRHGLSRPPRAPREAACRYEWPCPGDLLHVDTKRFARFTRPGHAVTGDRHTTAAEKRTKVGYEWVHSLVDDHSRLAYSELHPDERADTVTGFIQRGLAFYAAHGITAKRLMSDNAWAYTHNGDLARLLAHHTIRHMLIPARRPQTNGKVERYQQTLKREWGLGQTYRSSHHRAQALPYWLEYYNTCRPPAWAANHPSAA
jgi:transposase InsO family protein